MVPKNILYRFNIDQREMLKPEHENLTLESWVILEALAYISNWKDTHIHIHLGICNFWISYTLLRQKIPVVLKNVPDDTIYRKLAKLQEWGYIKFNKQLSQAQKKTFIQILPKTYSLFEGPNTQNGNDFSSENSSDSLRTEIRTTSDENPKYKYINNKKENINKKKEKKEKKISPTPEIDDQEDDDYERYFSIEPIDDSFLLRDDKLVEPKISVGKETELGANSPEFAYTIKDENGKVIKQSNNPYKVLTKKEADLEKGFVSDLINDYYPIDEMYLPIQDNASNERFRAKYPPLYPEFGNHMNIYQSCLRDFPKNEAKAQVLFEQLYHDKIDWSRVRSKQGMLPTQKEEIDIDFLMNMDYSTSATLTYFGIKYEKTGPNKERPVMKYKEIWVPIYPYSYLEKQAPTRLSAFLGAASNVPSYYQVLVDLIKDKEKKNGK